MSKYKLVDAVWDEEPEFGPSQGEIFTEEEWWRLCSELKRYPEETYLEVLKEFLEWVGDNPEFAYMAPKEITDRFFDWRLKEIKR